MKALIASPGTIYLGEQLGQICRDTQGHTQGNKNPAWSLFAKLLHVDPVLFLCCEMFPIIKAVPHRRIQLFVKLILKQIYVTIHHK